MFRQFWRCAILAMVAVSLSGGVLADCMKCKDPSRRQISSNTQVRDQLCRVAQNLGVATGLIVVLHCSCHDAYSDGRNIYIQDSFNKCNDGELAFLVGHEYGHIRNNDSANWIQRAHEQYVKLGLANHNVGWIKRRLEFNRWNVKYTQDFEIEADRYAVDLMKAHNCDRRDATGFLNRFDTSKFLYFLTQGGKKFSIGLDPAKGPQLDTTEQGIIRSSYRHPSKRERIDRIQRMG